MDGWQAKVLEKLPLAEAVLQAWCYLTDEEFLGEVFSRHHGRSYTGILSFGTLVRLTGDALLEHSGSGHRAFQQAHRREELDATMEACYGKLRRVPQSLSHGFLVAGSQRLRPVLARTTTSLPKSLRQFELLAIDGKKIKQAAKRLLAARKFHGSVLGGKALVALCLRTGLVVAMSSSLDGEANDPPLVPDLLAQVRSVLPQPRLYVLDRQFCDLKLPGLLTEAGDHYVIRYHAKVTFTPDRAQRVRRGTDRHGRKFKEEWGWLGRPAARHRRYVRRITLVRPGQESIVIVTDLLDAKVYPGGDLLELYRQRWGIERVFQQITEVFHLSHLIASTPQGTIFQCAFCLLLYNLLQTQRSYLAQEQSLEPEAISLENLFYDVCRQLIAWHELLGYSWTVRHLPRVTTALQLSRNLHRLLDNTWHDDWLKARKTNYRTPPPKQSAAGGHTSIYRLMQKNL
ncbi:MAG TPA: transposase [Bryobacteraceae bacterium]|nr:transposase [Bryobacteraceae bacterium]